MIASKIESLGKIAIKPIKTLIVPLLTPEQFKQIQTIITTAVLELENLVSLYKNSVSNIEDEKLKTELLKQLDRYEREIKNLIEKFYSTTELTSEEVKLLTDFVKDLKDIDVNVNLNAETFISVLERLESKTITDKLKEKISLDVYRYISLISESIKTEIKSLQEKLKESYSEDLAKRLDALIKLQKELTNVLSATPEELAYSTELQNEIKSLLLKIHQYDLDKIEDRLYSLSNQFETIAPQPEIQENLETTKFGKKIEEWFEKFSGAFSGGGYKEYLKTALTQFAYSIDPRLGAVIDLFGGAIGGSLISKTGSLFKGLGKIGLKLVKSPAALLGATGLFSTFSSSIKSLTDKLGLLSKSAEDALENVKTTSSIAAKTHNAFSKIISAFEGLKSNVGNVLTLVIDKSENIKSKIKDIVGSLISSIDANLGSVFNLLSEKLTGFVSSFSDIAKGFMTNIQSRILDLVSSSKQLIGNIVVSTIEKTKNILENVNSVVSSLTEKIFSSVKTNIGNVFSLTSEKITSVINSAKETLFSQISKISEITTSVKSSLSSFIENSKAVFGNIASKTSEVISDIIKSIASKLTQVKTFTTTAFTKTISKLTKTSVITSDVNSVAEASLFSRFFGGVGRVLNKLALPLNIGLTAFDIYSDYKKNNSIADALTSSDKGLSGAFKSALKGSSIGAILGSVVPGLGTITGTIVGGLTGLIGYGIKSLFDKKDNFSSSARVHLSDNVLQTKSNVLNSKAVVESLPQSKLTSTHKLKYETQKKQENQLTQNQTVINVNNTNSFNALNEDYLGLTKLILGY